MTDVSKDLERGGTLLHCWWVCKLGQSLWKIGQAFLITLKIELPYGILGVLPWPGDPLGHKNV